MLVDHRWALKAGADSQDIGRIQWVINGCVRYLGRVQNGSKPLDLAFIIRRDYSALEKLAVLSDLLTTIADS